jgi:hypothetical protein
MASQWQPQERGVQAQELALDEGDSVDAVPFGLLKVENFSCFRPLPHFGQFTRSAFERTRRS